MEREKSNLQDKMNLSESEFTTKDKPTMSEKEAIEKLGFDSESGG